MTVFSSGKKRKRSCAPNREQSFLGWMNFEDAEDLEIRYRVRRIVRHLASNSNNAPSFAFAFQKQVRMKPEQWRKSFEVWRTEVEAVVSNERAERGGFKRWRLCTELHSRINQDCRRGTHGSSR